MQRSAHLTKTGDVSRTISANASRPAFVLMENRKFSTGLGLFSKPAGSIFMNAAATGDFAILGNDASERYAEENIVLLGANLRFDLR